MPVSSVGQTATVQLIVVCGLVGRGSSTYYITLWRGRGGEKFVICVIWGRGAVFADVII